MVKPENIVPCEDKELAPTHKQRITSWQTVSIFVSSTFNDMHAERDYLVKRVFPELREWCEQRKLRLIDIDLRWGITEADATNKNIIKVCLNRIDECRPFFLCFLGQRRGWIPRKDEIDPDTCIAFPDLKNYIGAASVTEMEILHAVIDPMNKKERADRAFFYLREPSYLKDLPTEPKFIRNTYTNEGISNPDERKITDEELRLWREEMIPKTGRPFHQYSAAWDTDETTPELAVPLQCPSQEIRNQERWKSQWRELGIEPASLDLTDDESLARKAREINTEITKGRLGSFRCKEGTLADTILNDLKEAIAEQNPDHMVIVAETPLQKELDQQEQFLELNCSGYIRREGDFDALDSYVTSNSPDLFVLTASGGMGKTMLLANWIRSHQQWYGNDYPVFYRFIGASDGSTTVDAVIRSLLTEIKEAGLLPDEIPVDPTELRNKFPDFLATIGSHSRCIIVLDALNQLESGLKDLYWLPRISHEGIRMIVSFKREGAEAERLASQLSLSLPDTYYEIKPFESLEDRQKLVSAYLDQYLKQLDDKLVLILIKSPGANNPLFLKVVLSELRVYGSFANLEEKIREDFGTTPVEAFKAVLRRLEKDPIFTSIPAEQAVPLLFGFFSHARVGLTESELVNLFVYELSSDEKAAQEAVRGLIRQMRPFLAIREGRHDFFYESFRLAAVERYEGNDRERSQRLLTEWHHLLADYFEQLPLWVSERENVPTSRRAAELPYHLAWAGKSAHLGELLLAYELLETIVFSLGPYAAIDDISLILFPPVLQDKMCSRDQTSGLETIQGAISLSAHVLAQKPNQLPSQLVGRLHESENFVVRTFVIQIINNDKYPWLCPMTQSLTSEGGSLIRILTGHTDLVNAVAVTPDGRLIVSGSDDNTLKVWDLESGRELHNFTASSGRVNAVAVTPDGHKIISGSDGVDGNPLIIWDLDTGRELATLSGDTDPVTAVAVTSDGCRIVSGSENGTLKIWDLESGRELHNFTTSSGRVNAVAVTPDGRLIVSGSDDNTLKVWDLESGRELKTLIGHTGYVEAVAVTPDGRQIISGSYDPYVRSFYKTLIMWDLGTGRELHNFTGYSGRVNAVAVTPDGRRVISGSDDNTLKVWDLESGHELATLSGHSGPVTAVVTTPDGRRVISGSEDNSLNVWDIETSCKSLSPTGHCKRVTVIGMAPDGRYAVSGSDDNNLKVWDLENGRELATLLGHKGPVTVVAVTSDGRRIISGSKDNTLKVWDVETGRELHTFTGHFDKVTTVALTPNNLRAISGSIDRTIKIWSLGDWCELKTLIDHSFRVKIVAVTTDGHWVVSGANPNKLDILMLGSKNKATMKLWDVETGRELHNFSGYEEPVTAIAVTSDGCRIVSGSENGTLKVWDLENGRELATLLGHSGPVTAVAVTSDGRRIISGSKDWTLKVWDMETGRKLHTFYHAGSVTAMIVSPDGNWVVSGSLDNTLKVWDVESGVLIVEFYCDGSVQDIGYSYQFSSIIAGDSGGRIYINQLKGFHVPPKATHDRGGR